jgi:hypothetical protein
VELPGIEPGAENGVNCGDTRFDDAKRRDATCGYAEDVDGINMSTPLLSVPQTTADPSPKTPGTPVVF